MGSVLVLEQHALIAGWVAARTGYVPGGRFWAIGLMATDGHCQRIVAGCVFDNWRGHDVTGHIACDTAVTRRFLRAIHYFPYCVLGVRRITATVTASNHASIRFLKRLGFQFEGAIRQGNPDGSDRIIFGQLKEAARKWLDSR